MTREDKFSITDLSELDRFKILNHQIIKSILDLNDPKFTCDLIEQYLKRSERIISEIELSVRKKKTSDTYTLANDLKGSSLYIGTEKIIVISAFIYEKAKKRNIPPLNEAVLKLKEAFLESKAVLLEMVNSDLRVGANK